MRVNLGCGDRYADGWHNVDRDSPHRKDETVDLTKPLPWPAQSVTHAYLGHVLEHLTQGQACHLMVRLHRAMAPLGEVMIVGPDVDVAIDQALAGTLDTTYHSLDSIICGGRRWPGDAHLWRSTGADTRRMLEVAGFAEIKSVGISRVDESWPVADRVPSWQFAIYARCVPGREPSRS